MNKEAMLDTLITALLKEQPRYKEIAIPQETADKKRLLRSLMNVRSSRPVDDAFLQLQDTYLQQELMEEDVVEADALPELQPRLSLWQGDITKLRVDSIVNAANSALLGCFVPCHACIDNAIHTFSGVQLRLHCNELMEQQGYDEPTGCAKITPAYNLPSKYILHTVGPIIQSRPTAAQCAELASCYRSCFELADHHQLKSIAYCCISTGEFHFPNRQAAEIGIETVTNCLQTANSIHKVVFNVFKKEDYEIYADLLGKNR